MPIKCQKYPWPHITLKRADMKYCCEQHARERPSGLEAALAAPSALAASFIVIGVKYEA